VNTPTSGPCLVLVLALALGSATALAADPVHGVWREPDTGIDVEIRGCDENGALLCGHIVRVPADGPTADIHNTDPALRKRPLLGLEILSGFRRVDDGRWQGGGEYGRLPGRIYLPANGDTLGDHRNRYEVRHDGERLMIHIANCSLLGCLGKSVWRRAPAL
jgi:hypothetical protein